MRFNGTFTKAHATLDQPAYQKKYDDLVARYDALKIGIDELNERIRQASALQANFRDFLAAFEKTPDELAEFSLNAFNALTDFITVYSENDIRVTFRNGQEIKVQKASMIFHTFK